MIIVCFALLPLSCARRVDPGRPVKPAPAAIKTPAALPEIKEPVIRIGLKTESKSIQLSTDGMIHYTDGFRSFSARSPLTASVSFVAESKTEYFVQIGSYSSRENAEKAEDDLKSRYPTRIFENQDMHLQQLRIGPFSTQEQAQQVADEMKEKKYPGAFYVSDTAALTQLPDLILRNDLGDTLLKTRGTIQLWSGSGILSADGASFRGTFSLFINPKGRLTLINSLNMEDYLKGVVPNEIGPASEGTFEALKAQATAARTYALKNMKQFDADGYDLCATPRCQVYSGTGTEHPMTSKAVEDTAGEIISYNGEAINALYTSTCGGKTENAEYMFEGWNYPYLRSVECYPEEETASQGAINLKGSQETWSKAWFKLKTDAETSGDMQGSISLAQAENAVSIMLETLGKTSCTTESLSANHWAAFSDYLTGRLCWQKKRDALLNQKDYQYFVNRLQISTRNTQTIQSYLFLLHEGIVLTTEGASAVYDPYASVRRFELWQTLFNVLKHYHQVNTTGGMIREIDSDRVQIVDDLGVHSFAAGSPYLYQKLGETVTPRSSLNCASGDEVEYLAENGILLLLVCEVNRSGAAVDRSSKYSFWQETVTPAELAKRVSRYLDIGDIRDLEPLSYGVSQRVYEMKITGTRGSGILKGIRVRWALGLKDNLFTFERTLARDGSVKEFIFTGRGWGHGIGMCQIGAIGFARQGKNYQYILRHYYSGVQIRKVY